MRAMRNLTLILAVAAMGVLLLVAGCSSDEEAECTLTADAAACVDETIITKDDVAARIEKQRKVFGPMVPAEDDNGDGVPDESFTNYRREVTKQLVREELQRREIARRGIVVTDDEVKQAMQQVAEDSYLGDYEAMIQDYAAKGISEADLMEDVRPQLELSKLEEELRADIEVSDDEELEYYQQNIGQYVQPERYTTRQLITDDEATAQQAVARARAGEPFIDLVEELSVDPQKEQKKGSLGLVSPGQLSPELDAALFSLEVGEISDPVKAGNQWYVLTVEAVVPGYDYPFDEKKEEIKFLRSNQLYADKFNALRDQLMGDAAIAFHPDYDPDLIIVREQQSAPTEENAPVDSATGQQPGMESPVAVPQS